MGSSVQLESTTPVSALTPELRKFIDRTIVPALVREYLAEMNVAKQSEIVASSSHNTTATLRDELE